MGVSARNLLQDMQLASRFPMSVRPSACDDSENFWRELEENVLLESFSFPVMVDIG